MGDMMKIYELVEEKLGQKFKNIFYQSMRDDKVGDVGIFLYESSKDLMDLAGDDVFNCIKVHVQVNGDTNIESMGEVLNYLSEFTHRIESEESNTDGIEIISAEHLGPRAICIGRNQFNIPIYRSLVDLKYTLETE